MMSRGRVRIVRLNAIGSAQSAHRHKESTSSDFGEIFCKHCIAADAYAFSTHVTPEFNAYIVDEEFVESFSTHLRYKPPPKLVYGDDWQVEGALFGEENRDRPIKWNRINDVKEIDLFDSHRN